MNFNRVILSNNNFEGLKGMIRGGSLVIQKSQKIEIINNIFKKSSSENGAIIYTFNI